MPIENYITDPLTGRQTFITETRALAVSPPAPSESFNAELAVDDTPVNIVPAVGRSKFFITGIYLKGNKSISATTDATVDIYVADNATTATARKTLISTQVGKSDFIPIAPVFIEAEEGKFINGKTSDDDVFVTILGYYYEINGS